MNKQSFLNGTVFQLGNVYAGKCSFKYNDNYILRQSRHTTTNEVNCEDYHLNVTEVSETKIKGFTFVMDKQVEITIYYKNMIVMAGL